MPNLIRLVSEPHQASGVYASEPQASAVKTASNPPSSAAATSSPAFSGGEADQYPSCNPNFMGQFYPTRYAVTTTLAKKTRTCSTRWCDSHPKQHNRAFAASDGTPRTVF
ncbi:Uncharacterised protein [Mycobacteroides abscessus subsp. abscessus]|nr:Uncharacterised protein [Mycobacteroides abscessus subsp. abscessus]